MKKKQAGQSSQGSVDLISNLPKDAINLILVRLPIRDAVRMSILSKEWRYKWISIPDIVFDKHCLMEGASTIDRANVVDQVLLHHVGSICTFSCIFYVPSCSHIDSWILLLSSRGLKKLILKIEINNFFYNLPSSIFYCQELCHLELFYCELKVPPTFKGFRNLVDLNLDSCVISEDDIARVISESPLLERLTMTDFFIFGRLNIRAPNLRYLELRGQFEDLLLGNSPHLTTASISPYLDFSYWDNFEHRKLRDTCTLAQLTGWLHGIERLELSRCCLKFLCVRDVPEKLPATYDRLKYLEVDIELNTKEIFATLCILRCSPNLEELKIRYGVDEEDMRFYPSEEEAEFWGAKTQFDYILSNLHTVVIIGLAMLLDLEFKRCILSNSPVLETMKIYTNNYVEDEELLMIMKKLLQFQRAYARVEIIYVGHY